MQNCYKDAGSVPRQPDDQDGRLTNKHIKTLSFLQDVANENKELKAKVVQLESKLSGCAELHALAEESKERIKSLQEQYLKRADEINAVLIEKHNQEMMVEIENRLSGERSWEIERQQLKSEAQVLGAENTVLKAELEKHKAYNGKLELLEKKCESLQEEIDRLKQENTNYMVANVQQLEEIERLNNRGDSNKELKDQICELKQKNREFELKTGKLERDLAEAEGVKDKKHAQLAEAFRSRYDKLLKEKSDQEEKYKGLDALLKERNLEIERLQKALQKSEGEKTVLQDEMTILQEEIASLRHRLSQDHVKQTFKDFVQVKRELASVKIENDDLRQKMKFKHQTLPSLKPDGPATRKKSSSAKSERRLMASKSETGIHWRQDFS